MTFEETAHEWLDWLADKDAEFYEPMWNITRCGKNFVMKQEMEIKTHHPILSFNSKWGKFGIGAEHCYFDLCENLDQEKIEAYLDLMPTLEELDTDCENPQHEYTFISLVLLTRDFQDKALEKKIKRFRLEKRYHKEDGQFGWSTCRVCVVDLDDYRIYWSAAGDSLRNRLADETFQHNSIMDKLREKFLS